MTRRPPARLGHIELPLDSPVLEQVAVLERTEYLRRRAELAPLPPAAERGPMRESVWQAQIIRAAERLGFWAYHPHLSKFSARGWPDLTLLHERRGVARWAELKDDHGQLSEHQVAVIDRMRACGLDVLVWRPHDTLEAVVEWLQRP